jgi:hypothetical protein
VVGTEKVWSQTFTDFLAIVAKSEREMKEMMKSLGKYVRKKKPEVNVEKTKMMVFHKRKSEENDWNWDGRKIEQVNEFKYLGYTEPRSTYQRDSEESKYRRKWRGDFRRRMMMFENMIESILMYGAEIWGWKEQE